MDFIVLDCVSVSGRDKVLGEAKAAGIPVVCADSAPSDSSLYTSYVGSDFVHEGREVAIALAKALPSGSTILEILGTEDASPTIDRKNGFENELTSDYSGKFTVVQSTYCNFTASMAETYVSNYLANHTAPVAIFAEDDEMGLGAIQGVADYGNGYSTGTTPGSKVILVASINGEKTALQAVQNGTLYYTYDCNPQQGPTVVDVCDKIHDGTSVDKTNYMTERGYYKADATDAVINARSY